MPGGLMDSAGMRHVFRAGLGWAGIMAALCAASLALLPLVLILLATMVLDSLRDAANIMHWLLEVMLPTGIGQQGPLGNEFIRLHPWDVAIKSVPGACLIVSGLALRLRHAGDLVPALVIIPLYAAGAWFSSGMVRLPVGIAIAAEAMLVMLAVIRPSAAR
ncbi:Transporter, MFS superfamily [Granulibacter bethesdensis CGDNIH4]|nr:Transporter, MFS superfamily [Granulibacter bethesdensis CGDNIH4]